MADDDPEQPPERSEPPDYTVYKSRRRLGDAIRKPDLAGLRERLRRGGDGDGERPPTHAPASAPSGRCGSER